MPLATNPLLQANATATSKSGMASNANKSVDTGRDGASSFSNVFDKQARDKVAGHNDVPVKPARDKAVPDKDKPVAGKDKTSADQTPAAQASSVADNGNELPAKPAGAAADEASGDESTASGETLASGLADVSPGDALDPTLQAIEAQTPTVPVNAAAAITQAQPAVAVLPAPVVAEDSFDPDADPLKDLPAVQLALESANAKTHFAAQNQAANNASTNVDAEGENSQNLANNLASLSEQLSSDESGTESSDKSFSSLIGDGLKDVKSTAGDTRMDNFAERLASLSQAAQPARATASPVPLLNQPLAMHQSGWSEGIVDRVMYLSSQNLKSAEITLQPAELGRLDIRVNMAPDQQTQVTFMSAHMGVREALESQMSRLRESFTQQGLGQVDVNVADQSQQQAQQQAQEQASRTQRGGRGSSVSGSDGGDDGAVADATATVSQPAARVIGSSEIDYYA